MKTISIAVLLCSCVTALASAQTTEVLSADSTWMTERGERFVRGKALDAGAPLHTDGQGDLLLQCPDAVQRFYSCRTSRCDVKACEKTAGSSTLQVRELGLPG